MRSPRSQPVSRRQFTRELLRASSAVLAAPALVSRGFGAGGLVDGSRPGITHGVASGDVAADSAIIWSRTDRAARMVVEWSLNERFSDVRRVLGPVTGPEADFTAKAVLSDLPAGQRIFYRVQFEDAAGGKGVSEAVTGRLLTAPREARDVFLAWSGDTCGQGYGIDAGRGGLKTYAAIRAAQPDFFVHSGDTIYADNPLAKTVTLPDGSVWRNTVTDEKAKVAETLNEFRGNHRYNLLDEQVRACNADVPVFAQWDDHEVRNNWCPGQVLEDARYTERRTDVLAARAKQAFFDYWPIRPNPDGRIYRSISRGPLCELFFLDLRSHRGLNSANRQREQTPDAAFMGRAQLAWLMQALTESRATWKVICSDMPLSLLVRDTATTWEAFANGDDGRPLGRELEVADLLRHLKANRVRNVIWLTADVHYAASHHYDPARAAFTEFDPFWEFVSGPLHAGTFGPNAHDRTFGPETRWQSRTPGQPSSGPWTNQQFFGTVRIDAKTGAATVAHLNRDGEKLWSIELPPHPGA